MKTNKNKLFYGIIGLIFIVNCFILYYFRYVKNIDIKAVTKVRLNITHIDLGNSKLNQYSFANYKIHNDGQNLLTIKNVKIDCHCTVAEWDRVAVKPQDSTNIRVRYDNHIQGYYKRVVVVELNTPNSPIVLTFAGNTK
jgi:Protein of unknown function (DUF1573)